MAASGKACLVGERRDKREVIMKAAEALFEARRFHEITMDDIAQRAKVGKGTIYRYFADKEALFFEVAAAGYDALCALVDHHAAETTDFRQSLARVCEAVGGFLRRRHRLWHMMQMEDRRQLCRHGRGRDAWLERRGRLGGALSGIVRGGVASGWIRTDIPAESLAIDRKSVV